MANTAHNHERGVDAEARNTGGAEFHVGNNWLRLFGLDITHILVVVVVGLVGLGLWQHQSLEFRAAALRDLENRKAFLEQHSVTQKMLGDIIVKLDSGQKQAERAAYMQTYVLTLDERERKALKLAMPIEFRTGYQPPK